MAQATVIGHQLSGDSPSLVVKALFPFLVPFLLLFVLLRYFSTGATINNNNQRKRPPPSPPALPLIGHLHLVRAHPHVSMRSLAARHGGEDLMLLRLGTVPTLVASSPRAAQAVLRTHDQSLASRPSSIFGDILGYGPSDVGLAPYGNAWRQAKKLVTTHLLSTKKVQSYRAAREEEVGVVIDKIRSAAMADAGGVDLTELLSLFTTDMVSRAVAGGSFRVGGLDKMFKEVMDASMALLGGFSLENFYPGLAKVAGGVLMWPGRRRAEKLRDRWDEVLDKVIDQHASMAADGAPAPDESDFTDVLLSVQEEYGLTRDSIKAILADMFAAGADAPYLVLEFAMAQLMLHQDVMARLQAEVRSIMMPTNKGQQVITEEHLTGMSYLKAVIKETLRLHPPSPLLLPHQSLEECTVDGYVVPAGATVFVNAWAIGRDPRFWEAAEEFKPERFINNGATDEQGGGVDFRGFDFQFLPFGSGRRMCPGMNFALANVEIMLANLVWHFDWEMAGASTEIDMTEVFGLTVHRKEKLILTPRLQSYVAQPRTGLEG
ncbi:indolin-2-one monooxygenase [Sorghum bicolor]|uniref:Uncharacterized protein n=1 Tax=Sorghum bicolor TaxID=4558 RepID=C5Z7V9_SORBI|nr:indolin-2-one monooxygenase [Sorghum bicolor]EER90226.1 hypothetical protein SORBI_3010G230900 [Sorghum bicolor]|eukprot:XP_002438859.1 indolin-2-one monooxygenase [Sorghum bicolor]